MVTISENQNTFIKPDSSYVLIELRGLSTDTKPFEFGGKKIDNGSVFIEIDTGKVFMFDLENKQWKEI